MAIIKRKKKGVDAKIPTSSMADIAFLLLIFFMVTTVFKVDSGVDLQLPLAEKVEKLQMKNLAIIWITDQGKVAIEDKFVPLEFVSNLMDQKMFETNGELIVQIKADRNARYGIVDAVFEELKEAQALRVVLGANVESGGR
ncbi:MAG TPA: biopolymer transporter ExbD [Firmicutes bacterium]|nr:biopolymer transporter ExbD [Bacillota bacterium]